MKASLILNSNPNIKWCPFWILNFVAKSTLLDFFANLKKKCKNFKGSKFEKKMHEKPELYGWIRKRVDSYLEEQADHGQLEDAEE